MHRPQSYGNHHNQQANMYDDQPSRPVQPEYQHRSSSLQDQQQSRQDPVQNPQRGPAADGMRSAGAPDRGQWQQYDSGYSNQQEYRQDEPRRSRGETRGRYYDRDREGYRSPRYDRSRSQSRSRSRSRGRSPYYGAPPSRTIILEGIPINMTQEDGLAFMAIPLNIQILNEFKHSFKVDHLEEVRLIKDKKTGLSRQFAFAQFAAIENAKTFLNQYYPAIQLYGGYDPSRTGEGEGAMVRVAYSREKEERDRAGKNEDDWKCDVCYLVNYSHRMMCFRCNSPRTRPTATGVVGVITQAKMSTFSGFATTGDSDVSPDNTASQFLLFRGLEPGVTEELLAKGVAKLYKSSGDSSHADSHVSKKTKIVSTSSDTSLGAKEGSLRRVLLVRDRKSNDSWRYGFAEFNSVEDAQAAMAKYNASDRFTISSKPVMISYIHAGVFVPVLQAPSSESEKFTFSPLLNPSMKLMYWDEAGYVSELNTVQDNRSALAKARDSVKTKLAAAAANEGLINATKDGDAKAKKRKVEKDASTNSKKAVAPHLQFWSNRHAELHGLPTKVDEEPEADSSVTTASKIEKPASDSTPTQSFADMDRKCCLLCSRQFKTEAEVNKHERISQLHRDNMLNEDLKKKALTKLSKTSTASTEGENSNYRDRAKERRQAFNQPKQPAAQHNKTPKDPSDSASTPAAPAEEDIAPTPSKGAALLGKMGWTAGEGLGAQGTGRKEAITTELYTQGVGLGAQGGKIGDAIEEAERSTRGSYADFVSKSRDKAKERFEGMS